MRCCTARERIIHGGLRELDLEGAQLAAITHGHSLGYMPAAAVTHIISRILTDENPDLKEIVLDARDMMEQLFAGDRHQDELIRIMNLAGGAVGECRG